MTDIDYPATTKPSERRRVVAATVIGTTIEWYDFFIFAAAAGLVFGQLYFAPAGSAAATLLAFATVGVSFLFRPLGAFLAGSLGDRYGRRIVLTFTLVLMGAATTLVGLLPTYEMIGVSAPILLVLLRILQGVSAGGEWGAAALMSVEHAPVKRRGLYGSSPQVGVPLGLLAASAVMAAMTAIAPGDAFSEWGWRVPFLISVPLIAVGYFVRRGVQESPVFTALAQRKDQVRTPLITLFRRHSGTVILAAVVFAGSGAVGYMTTGGFVQNYATNPDGPVALERGPVLWAVAVSSVVWLLSTLFGGWVSDRLGRRRTMAIGSVALFVGVLALFPLLNTATLGGLVVALAFLSIGNGIIYGPLSSFFAELFPVRVRFSGASVSYALGSILGGAFAPMIATALVQATGSTLAVTVYLSGMTTLGLVAVLFLPDHTGIPLAPQDNGQVGVRV
ncbi:MFS transporter [Microbacterium karelineae]|uniref:MFS transporter n=1 Tax=Microbacterium karelineae TaxID=2654283 RepID=UPI0012EA60E3|nr:MFS transporter [Microbacterium karelineae]